MIQLAVCKKIKCPSCGTPQLINIGLDQLCGRCDWSNASQLVALGQMDHLFLAARDFSSAESGMFELATEIQSSALEIS